MMVDGDPLIARWTFAALALAFVVACTGGPGAPDGDTWVGTITTEGDVTTVINESGSVWGGAGRLVEEASIGVDVGADEYMLGDIAAVHVSAERIWVVDRQVPIVRSYDYDGNWLGDLGGQGEGPGEYTFPAFIAEAADGRIFLLNGRVLNVYSPEGEPIGRWPTGFNNCCVYPMGVDGDGVPWLPTAEIGADRRIGRNGVNAIGPDGPIGEMEPIPEATIEDPVIEAGGRQVGMNPYEPAFVWTVGANGDAIAGGGNDYRFEVRRGDGTSMIVERRQWDPVPMKEGETEYWRRFIRMMIAQSDPPEGWQWDGAMPEIKPVFFNFVGAQGGEIWVLRYGEAFEVGNCIDPLEEGARMVSTRDFCWPLAMSADVFDADGRFLGPVVLPEEIPWLEYSRTSIRGDTLVTPVEDEAGTITVRRYRLLLPEDK